MITTGSRNTSPTHSTVVPPLDSRPIEALTMPDGMSIVFVVDDDVSVRESLELMIRSAGWQPLTFASAQEFLSCPRLMVPC